MTCITTLIALIVAFVGLQQFLLARERFKLDLFDRRFAIFKATQVFVNEIICHHSSPTGESSRWIQQFHNEAQTAAFLFDDEISEFMNDLWKKGNQVAVAYRLKNDPQACDANNDAFKRAGKIQEEMFDVQNQLESKFSKYLKFSNWKYGFILGISN